MDDFLSNFVLKDDEKELSDSKKDVMKFLKQIGVDTRFVSFFDDEGDIKLYIENLRFSKFSKKRRETFNKHYPDMEVVRSSLFQKICSRSSKTLAESLSPKERILIPRMDNDYNKFLYIVIEPYSRKYGIRFIEYDENNEKIKKAKKNIAKKLGLTRNLTQYEEAYIEKWLQEYKYNLEIIDLALKKTTSKSFTNVLFCSFSIDSIITPSFSVLLFSILSRIYVINLSSSKFRTY